MLVPGHHNSVHPTVAPQSLSLFQIFPTAKAYCRKSNEHTESRHSTALKWQERSLSCQSGCGGNNHVASSLPACCLLHAPIPHKSDKKRMKDQIDTTHQLLQCKNAPQTHCRSRWLCSPDIGILQGFSTPRLPAFGLSLRLFLQEWCWNG